jgi:hypothetical protein
MIDDPLLADKMACQWTGIEHAMEFANGHPASARESSRWLPVISTS